jgi:hypothetical protein
MYTIKQLYITPIVHGLSDHDAQLVVIKLSQKQQKDRQTYPTTNTNMHTITNFQSKLYHETWDFVFEGSNGYHYI